jgi:hypothetical protein
LEELIIDLKIYDSETNLQQFHNGLALQVRPFCQSFIIREFITYDLKDFINWYINEETDNVKANESMEGRYRWVDTSPTSLLVRLLFCPGNRTGHKGGRALHAA